MFDDLVPESGWENPYFHDPEEIYEARLRGLRHSLQYPIVDYAAVMPYDLMNDYLDDLNRVPLLPALLRNTGIARFGTTWDEMFTRLGLEPYPHSVSATTGPYLIPEMPAEAMKHHMGVTIARNNHDIRVFTYSCTACHLRNLFGKPVIGLPSLKSRAYDYVNFAKSAARLAPRLFLKIGDNEEKKEILRTKDALAWVAAPKPKALGLDTSIAAVSASLDLRAKDEFSSRYKTPESGKNLAQIMKRGFDSKPGTWWLFRYKNRFLADGSVRGNPIVTNILWNEIGRGGDLRGLETWFENNQQVIEELTTAVMETEAPSWFDFFAEHFDLKAAKKGERHFQNLCQKCHGSYEKNWHNQPEPASLADLKEYVKTITVRYSKQTRVIDVGTDPERAEGIKFLAMGLNNLKLSKTHGATLEYTGGYVPQPLIGIWARWPYFHNNSAANLCEVLTPARERLQKFYILPAEDKHLDYDQNCVGFPYPSRITAAKKKKHNLFDATLPGLHNSGHDEGIFIENGRPRLSTVQKRELIEFLKTL